MTKEADESLKAEAVKLYQEGSSARQVGRALHISHQTVLNFCRQAGLDVRPPHSNAPPN
jgi:transposase-like protein